MEINYLDEDRTPLGETFDLDDGVTHVTFSEEKVHAAPVPIPTSAADLRTRAEALLAQADQAEAAGQA